MSATRVVILIAVVAALLVIAELTGLRARLSLEGIRTLSATAGGLGMLLFVGTFVGAHIAHLPGMVFVAAAVLSWGKLAGFALAFVGAVLASTASFLVVRAVGGRVESQRPRLKKLLQTLERRPVRTVVLLRILFWMAPAVNIGLALSPVRLRDFVVGSMLGLFLPILGVTLFIEQLVGWFMR